ncbi:MAG: DHH family phosphoesterase [Desulfomonilaceae bacterium]
MLEKIASILKAEDDFLVVTHINPDGDALGSLLGMHLTLTEMGKHSQGLCADKFPAIYNFLPGHEQVVPDLKGIAHQPRFIIAVDAAEENRISGDLSNIRNRAKLINIDHHVTNPGFGDINCVQPDATSTAEIVHEIIKRAGHKLSVDVGKCLYTGLVTDTGGFRFAGVNSRTLRTGAEMLAAGFESYDVIRPLYEEYPIRRIYLERLLLERLEFFLDGKLIISTLYSEDFQKFGADMSETESLVNRLRESKGVLAGILFTTMPDNIVRVSFRSKDSLDVSAIAKSLGGGGHSYAAGLKSTLPLQELKERIVQAVAQALD